MKLPHLLDHDPVLSGAHAAHIQVRPFRLAYIVPHDRSIVARVIASCSLQWGGFFHQIIPVTADGGIATLWRDMLRVGDPDLIVDAAGVTADVGTELKTEGWSIHRWNHDERFLYINGSLIYAGVYAENRKHNADSFPPAYLLADPKIASTHKLFLPAIARYGLLQEEEAQAERNLHGWAESVRLERLIRRVEVNLEHQIDGLLGGTLSMPIEEIGGGNFHTVTLPRLAAASIRSQPPSYSLSSIPGDRGKYDEGFLSTIVVTGQPGSIEDLALFWNIRAARTESDPFPLWIPLEYLDSDLGAGIVNQALAITKFQHGSWPLPEIRLHIISTSLEAESLIGRLEGRFPEASIRSTNLNDFVVHPVTRFAAVEDREAHFSDGFTRIGLPRPVFLDHFGRMDRVSYEFTFDEGKLPGRHRLTDYSLRGQASLSMAVTRSGAFADFSDASRWPSLVPLQVPTGWHVLEQYFASRGYDISPSDKARTCSAVGALFPGREPRVLLNSSLVYDLLRDLSDHRSGSQRSYFIDRPALTFSAIKDRVGRDAAQVVLAELVRARLLHRGAMLKCSSCQLERWYPLDNVTERWRCDGCREEAEVPLDANVTTWRYRINELVATGFDQGAITPVNLMIVLDWETRTEQQSLLGYFPGIIIDRRQDEGTQVRTAEIDVVAIVDGRLTIAECKESGEHLSETDAIRFIELGHELDADRVIFATATSFPSAIKAVPYDRPVNVEWWERDELLDRCRQRSKGDHVECLQSDRPKLYLKELMRRLSALD